tara:strand:+ start:467 stop:2140 length:1674 start_codon:yes stop_codon:yes gene_type:complete
MSYRDPKIIVDRSTEIYAQGANQLGQTMGKFVEDSAKTKLEETGLRIKQINAIGQWGQLERDKSETTVAKNASKVSPGLADQYIEMQTKRYNDLISRSVASKINGGTTSQEERDWIQKESMSLKMAGATVEKFRVSNELNKQEVEDNVSDGIINSPDTVWNSLEDKINYNSLNNIETRGVVSEKTLNTGGKNGQFSYNIKSTIDSKTELGKSIIDAWELPVDEKTGLATIDQENLDFANLKSPLTHITPALEWDKRDTINYIEKGRLKPLAFFQDQEFATKSIDGKTVTYSNGIFDKGNFATNISKGLQDEAAAIVKSNSTKGQLAYINSRIPLEGEALMSKGQWDKDYPNVEDKIGYIKDELLKKNLEFATNQLRSRKATPEDVEKEYATAEGLDVFYDPTVAKVVDTNVDGPTEEFDVGVITADDVIQDLYLGDGLGMFSNMELDNEKVMDVSRPGPKNNILRFKTRKGWKQKKVGEKWVDDLDKDGNKIPTIMETEFKLNTKNGVNDLVTAIIKSKGGRQSPTQQAALTRNLKAKIEAYRKKVKDGTPTFKSEK